MRGGFARGGGRRRHPLAARRRQRRRPRALCAPRRAPRAGDERRESLLRAVDLRRVRQHAASVSAVITRWICPGERKQFSPTLGRRRRPDARASDRASAAAPAAGFRDSFFFFAADAAGAAAPRAAAAAAGAAAAAARRALALDDHDGLSAFILRRVQRGGDGGDAPPWRGTALPPACRRRARGAPALEARCAAGAAAGRLSWLSSSFALRLRVRRRRARLVLAPRRLCRLAAAPPARGGGRAARCGSESENSSAPMVKQSEADTPSAAREAGREGAWRAGRGHGARQPGAQQRFHSMNTRRDRHRALRRSRGSADERCRTRWQPRTDDDALAELLHPVTPAQFEESYWERRRCTSPIARRRRSTVGCSRRRASGAGGGAGGGGRRAAAVFRDGERRPSRAPLQDFCRARSLIVNRVDKLWPPIGRRARRRAGGGCTTRSRCCT